MVLLSINLTQGEIMKVLFHLFLFLFIFGPSIVLGQIHGASFEEVFVEGIPSGTRAVRIAPVEERGIPFGALYGKEVYKTDKSKVDRDAILFRRANEICFHLGLDTAEDMSISYKGSVRRASGGIRYSVFEWLRISAEFGPTTSEFTVYIKRHLISFSAFSPAHFDSILCQAPETHTPAIVTLLETSPRKVSSHYNWREILHLHGDNEYVQRFAQTQKKIEENSARVKQILTDKRMLDKSKKR